jgi:hypothetical protein
VADYVVGYGRPPKHTQFPRGQSGNPSGRPQGSQNLATVLLKTMRQRIKVAENGQARYVTKFEAVIVQLVNKALRGDVNAIHELRNWIQFLEESIQPGSQAAVAHENDEAVMARALERIRRSEALQPEGGTDSADATSIEEKK